MKRVIAILSTIVFVFFVTNTNAQKRRAKARKARATHRVAHKKGPVAVRRAPRKRVRRTRVVHYHYRHLPRRGAVVASMHANALTIRFGGVGFRFHSGVWYRPNGAKWVVARPAYGIRIRTLPVGCRKIILGPSIYYYYYGTYYVKKNEEYEVVEAPMNAEIGSLPEGYETITVDGKEYYKLDDIYYMPSANEEGDEILVVVKDPTG